MIRFSLRCDEDHRFESWFGSGADFERLTDAGLVACAVCGSTTVEKDLMAPNLGSATSAPDLAAPASPAEQALRALRRHIEANSEDVGRNFAREARRIHDGIAPERSIIGEARPSEAKALIEDGVRVAPLPWRSRRSN